MVDAELETITCSEGHSRRADNVLYPCPWYACRSVFHGDSKRSPQLVAVPAEGSGKGYGQLHFLERQPNEPGGLSYSWVNVRPIGGPFRQR